MSDTSVYDARIFEEQLLTECARQRAAEEELNYWKRRREVYEEELIRRVQAELEREKK